MFRHLCSSRMTRADVVGAYFAQCFFGKMQQQKKHLNNNAGITQIASLGFEPACGRVMKGSSSCSHCPDRVRWRRRISVALSGADGNIHLAFVSQSLGRPGPGGSAAHRALPVGFQTCFVAAVSQRESGRLHSLPCRLYQLEQQTLMCAAGGSTWH